MGVFAIEPKGDEERLVLDDPSGGTFAGAAGNFDQSVHRFRDDLELLGHLPPYEDRALSRADLQLLLIDVDVLLDRVGEDEDSGGARNRRGLLRLRVLVEHCLAHPSDVLVWHDDQ